jgi:CheY-like chemotaxis protein
MNGSSILVVDDDDDLRSVIAELLELEGYRVLTAGNGADALSLLARHDVGLVLLDLGLPGVDGREVLRRRRIDPRLAAIPVLLLSGCLDDAPTEARHRLGKPFDLADLLVAVNGFLAEPLQDA